MVTCMCMDACSETTESAHRCRHRGLRRPDPRPEVPDADAVRRDRTSAASSATAQGETATFLVGGLVLGSVDGRAASQPGAAGQPRRREDRPAARPDRHQPGPPGADPGPGRRRRGRCHDRADRARAHRADGHQLQPGHDRRSRGGADGADGGAAGTPRWSPSPATRPSPSPATRWSPALLDTLNATPGVFTANTPRTLRDARRRPQRAAAQHPRHRQDDRRADPDCATAPTCAPTSSARPTTATTPS